MRREFTSAWLATGTVAMVWTLATAANAQVCGNGVIEFGEQCEPPMIESCTNSIDDDGDLLIDCLDPECTAIGPDAELCGVDCLIVPACVAPLRDPAKMVFNMPKRLDTLAITMHVVPTTSALPTEPWSLSIANNPSGVMYTELLPDGFLQPTPRGRRWVYVADRTGQPMIYRWVAKEKFDKKAQAVQYLLKIKMEADFAGADPDRNTGATEDELKSMTLQITMGDDVFAVTADWERKHTGWYLPNHHVDPVP